MALGRQIWTLTRKNLLIVLGRHWFATLIKALVLPVLTFGIGEAVPIRSLADALTSARGQHDTVAFVSNGNNDDIANIISELSETVRASGYNAVEVEDSEQLSSVCKSSFRATTKCYAAITFHSSAPYWNYTIHVDGSLGGTIDVQSHSNDQEIYLLPLQYAIDSLIASSIGKALPTTVEEYPFTDSDNELRDLNNRHSYQGALQNVLGVAFFLGMVGICYEVAGFVSMERELGMSQLIEAMMPNTKRWQPQVARIVSYHLAFNMMYLPGWLVTACMMAALVFPASGYGIMIVFHILAGLALSGYSIFCAAFFRRSQLAGPTATICSLILAVLGQFLFGQLSLARGAWLAPFALTLAFPPVLYATFVVMLANFQYNNKPIQVLSNAPGALPIPPVTIWALFIIQIFAFPALAAFVERYRHGKPSVERKLEEFHNESGVSIAIRMKSFNKVYKPGFFDRVFSKKKKVHAVKDLNLEVVQGQVAVLVGANGSGKTTTLKAVAGLHPATSGIIQIDGRGGLGLCPQNNVMWDELTVCEHVKIFNELKSTDCRSNDFDDQDLIKTCDLVNKGKARSRTLSGGQKRKLQLAMMLAGGSRVCCIDEVSSGLDPLARRKIWEIILAERGRRTILLSTHYLEECDILSDHIAILSRGILKTEGSAAQLKTELGGYTVVVKGENFIAPLEFVDVPNHNDHGHTIYQFDDLHDASDFCTILDRMDVDDYQIQGPTIEEVFLRLADEIKGNQGGAIFAENEQGRTMLIDNSTPAATEEAIEEDVEAVEMNEYDYDDRDELTLSAGSKTTFSQQVMVLFQKRFIILSHEYMAYLAAFAIPIIAGGLVTRFLYSAGQALPAITCTADTGSYYNIYPVAQRLPEYPNQLVYGPRSLTPTLSSLYPNTNFSHDFAVDTILEVNTFIVANYSYMDTGLFVDQGGKNTIAYQGNGNMVYAMFALNLLDNVLLNTTITTSFLTFSSAFDPGVNKTLPFVIFLGLVMAVYPAFLALYPAAERLRNVRSVQYSNGVRSAPLWLAYLLFDGILILLVSVIVLVLFSQLWHGWYHLSYLFPVFLFYGLTAAAFSYVVSIFASSHIVAWALAAGIQAVLMCLYFAVFICMVTYSSAATLDRNILIAHFTFALVSPSANMLRALLLTLNVYRATCQGTGFAEDPGSITVYGGPILYLVLQCAAMMVFVVWWDAGGRPPRVFQIRSSHRVCDEEKDTGDEDTVLRIEVQRVEDTAELALRVLHVTKRFGSQVAVDNITFGVQQGECFALLGPNGAGETTSVSLVRGDLKPSNGGEILVNDISVTSNRTEARQHLGVCPQFDAIDSITVLQHLRFYAKAKGLQDPDTDIANVMRAVGLTSLAHRMAPTLSGGNKRRLSLAIALLGNPPVLLLDEVSSGMDAAAKRVIWRILARIVATRAVLITSHDMEECQALADRAGILAKKMLALGTADELRERHGNAHNIHLVHRSAPRTEEWEMEHIKDWIKRNLPGAKVDEKTYHGQLRFSVSNGNPVVTHPAPPPPVPVKGGGLLHTTFTPSISSSLQDEENAIAPILKPPPYNTHNNDRHKHTTLSLIKLIEANKRRLGIAYYSVSPTTLDQVFMNVVTAHNIKEENSQLDGAGKARWWSRGTGGSRDKKEMEESVEALVEEGEGEGGEAV